MACNLDQRIDISDRQSPTLRSEVPFLLLHELQKIAGAARTPAEPVVIALLFGIDKVVGQYREYFSKRIE